MVKSSYKLKLIQYTLDIIYKKRKTIKDNDKRQYLYTTSIRGYYLAPVSTYLPDNTTSLLFDGRATWKSWNVL